MTQRAAGAFPLRRFAATRISQAADALLRATGGTGTVEGVHRTALNFRWEGALLTIAHESMGGLPNGILVVPPIAFDEGGTAVGMAVQSDGATLWVPSASLAVSLSGAAIWSPAMPVVRGLTTSTRARRAQRALRHTAGLAPRVGLGPLMVGMIDGRTSVGSLGRAAAAGLADILEALSDQRTDRAVAAALPMIGLGPGATPSGDDLLVGLAAGLAVTDHPLARPFAAGVSRNAVGLTTSLAETYLTHAGRLEFAERVHRAAVAVLTAPEPELRGAMTDAMAWGASSGADLLVGLLVGVQAAAAGLPRRLRACVSEGTMAA